MLRNLVSSLVLLVHESRSLLDGYTSSRLPLLRRDHAGTTESHVNCSPRRLKDSLLDRGATNNRLHTDVIRREATDVSEPQLRSRLPGVSSDIAIHDTTRGNEGGMCG